MIDSEALKRLSSISSETLTTVKGFFKPLWKALWYDFSELMFPQKCLSISIERNTFHIAYVTKIFSRFKVHWIKEYPFDISSPDIEFFSSSVALASKEHKLKHAAVTLSIPKVWTITKVLEFPSTVKESLNNVISYEMDRFTPFDEEDVFYDFKVVEETNEKIKVLLAVTKIQLLKPFIDALYSKGIKVEYITINSSAIGNLINHSYKPSLSLYVEIDEVGYEGVLFLQSKPINFFANKFRGDGSRDRATELTDSIRNFLSINKKNELKPQIFILFKVKNSTLKESLKSIVNMPLTFLDEIDLRMSFSPKTEIISYSSLGSSFLALKQKTDNLNLMSKGKVNEQKKPIFLTIFLLILLLIILVLYFVAPLYLENKKIEEIDKQLTLKREEVKKVETLKKEIEALRGDLATIDGFKSNRQMTLNIIKEFTSIIPKNAWLTRIRITEKVVEIEGYASSATELLPKIEASKFLQKVEFASPTFRDTRLNADRFSIKMEIENVTENATKE
ncbi:MAG: pilus assembly protein PilM [Thermodesulfovibrionales bacterium]|nr:pilus assembly protein PilM [Thermodesulfovibrionales bacterium]